MTVRIEPRPGDVWAVRTTGLAAKLIRVGEFLDGKPSLDNHVVVVHHQQGNRWWGVEGRPGGVGWADLTKYLTNDATVSNQDQPKSAPQREAVCALMVQMLGTPYDWEGIGVDAARDLHLDALFEQSWSTSGVPGQVVCSSLAAYGYLRVGLPHPSFNAERFCQPSDWTQWCQARGWAA